MEFNIGDHVVHPAYGVGLIEGLEERCFSGKVSQLYYKVDLINGSVWVPVQADRPSRLRPITTQSELDDCRKLLTGQPSPLNQDHRERHQELSLRLRSGLFTEMCEVVRDLTARGWVKSLNEADSASLKKAREALCQEWAAAEGISVSEANQQVDTLLLKARQAYTASEQKLI